MKKLDEQETLTTCHMTISAKHARTKQKTQEKNRQEMRQERKKNDNENDPMRADEDEKNNLVFCAMNWSR